jgi:hypothetical protein
MVPKGVGERAVVYFKISAALAFIDADRNTDVHYTNYAIQQLDSKNRLLDDQSINPAFSLETLRVRSIQESLPKIRTDWQRSLLDDLSLCILHHF